MRIPCTLCLVLLAVCLALGAAPALAEKAPAAKPSTSKESGKPAPVTLRPIEFESLETRLGDTLIVRTTNDTTRKGTLEHYSGVSIQLQLGPDSGSILLSIPRESIRQVLIEVGEADPLFPSDTSTQKGDSSAKKN